MGPTVDELMEHLQVKTVRVSVILCINLASGSQSLHHLTGFLSLC